MKLLRKQSRKIASAFFVIFSSCLFISCGTLKSSTLISSENLSNTKVNTGVKKYSYKTIKTPTYKDPSVHLRLMQEDQFLVQKRNKYKEVYDIKKSNRTGWTINFILLVGGFGSLGMYGSDNIESRSQGEGFLYGASIGLIIYIFLRVMVKTEDTRTKYTYKNITESDYKSPNPIINKNLTITSSEKSIIALTDQHGKLIYSPVKDFNILNVPDNSSISFKLSLPSESYMFEPIVLKPSLWMHQYSLIQNDCNVYSLSHTEISPIATVRKGMEYRILTEISDKYKIELFNKAGWINKTCAEIFYSVPIKQDISTAIKIHVEERMNNWQQQGEFESPTAYIQRMSQRQKKLLELTNEAMILFQKDYVNLFEWDKSIIYRYDPNSQTFQIHIPDLESIIISVPLDKARAFKENWQNVIIKDQQFVLLDGEWKLSSLKLVNPVLNYTVKYNSKIGRVYDPTNQFAFDLDPLNVVLPESDRFDFSEAEIIDNYSINTNLPNTNMTNPDGIAVIIGNANYEYTNTVDFAVNDAQLMKVYLTKVLGFKPGNIIYEPNTSKGKLEGIFGTTENHKGKLHDWIKADVSDVFIYYSGHGAPGLNDKKGYLVPVDCDPSRVELQGYSLDVFYKNLAKLPSKSTTIVIDACFSGTGIIDNISAIVPEVSEPIYAIENGVVLTSSKLNQVSSWYNGKRHGLFTYFFLKSIHDYKNSDNNHDGNLTYQEIFDYISDNSDGIPYYSRKLHGIKQTPTIIGNAVDNVVFQY